MNTKGKNSNKESKTKVTASTLMRLAGLSAMAAGIIFAAIQPIHPPDFLPSVTTTAWATIMPVKLVMCLLFLIGFTGLYARQIEETGWLGLVGYLMLSLTWVIQTAFIFAEIARSPPP
jgi:cytochrome bd-type quinol oxidase subunit 1